MGSIYTLVESSRMLGAALGFGFLRDSPHLDRPGSPAIFIISDIKNKQKRWCLA